MQFALLVFWIVLAIRLLMRRRQTGQGGHESDRRDAAPSGENRDRLRLRLSGFVVGVLIGAYAIGETDNVVGSAVWLTGSGLAGCLLQFVSSKWGLALGEKMAAREDRKTR